jgi:hypothetical protein
VSPPRLRLSSLAFQHQQLPGVVVSLASAPPPPDLRRGGGERLGRPGESEIELRGRHSDGGRSRRGQRSTRGEGDHAAACKKFSSRRGSIEEDVHGRRRRAGEEGLARHRRAPRPPPKDRYVRLLPACL